MSAEQPIPELPRVTGEARVNHPSPLESCSVDGWHDLEVCTVDVEAESERAAWEQMQTTQRRRREKAHLN